MSYIAVPRPTEIVLTGIMAADIRLVADGRLPSTAVAHRVRLAGLVYVNVVKVDFEAIFCVSVPVVVLPLASTSKRTPRARQSMCIGRCEKTRGLKRNKTNLSSAFSAVTVSSKFYTHGTIITCTFCPNIIRMGRLVRHTRYHPFTDPCKPHTTHTKPPPQPRRMKHDSSTGRDTLEWLCTLCFFALAENQTPSITFVGWCW